VLLFVPMQQELGCINSDGQILGKVRLDESKNSHFFTSLMNQSW
jgi:hypothetical protein